jgi:hypothetical protein
MYLEKLPLADENYQKLYGINVKNNCIEVLANKDYITSIKPEVWFNAFKEHYIIREEIPKDYIRHSREKHEEIFVGNSDWDWIINFQLDLDRGTLKFFYDNDNPFAKDLVVSFVNRLGNFN